VPVTAQGYYHLPLPGLLTPWATVGFGLYDYMVKVGSANDHSTKSGFNVGAGTDLSFPGSGFKFGLDLRYHVISTDVKSTKLITALARMYL
jgi:hypothetical protein